MAYDSLLNRIVLVGGFNSSAFLTDTWTWDGTNWLTAGQVRAAPYGPGAMAFDASRNRMVVYNMNYTFQWDGMNWDQRSPANSPPSVTGGAAMAFDSARQRVVLFGGEASSGVLGETWEFGP